MYNCPRIIAVNGIKLDMDIPGNGQTNSMIPINHAIRNGDNYIELMFPNNEYMSEETTSDSQCKVSIYVKSESEENEYKITDLVYSPQAEMPESLIQETSSSPGNFIFEGTNKTTQVEQQGNFSVGEISLEKGYTPSSGYRFKRTFTANVPFPEWEFFTAEKIFNYPMDNDKY